MPTFITCGTELSEIISVDGVNTGLVVEDSSLPERVGEECFTEIIHFNYDDELEEEKEKE